MRQVYLGPGFPIGIRVPHVSGEGYPSSFISPSHGLVVQMRQPYYPPFINCNDGYTCGNCSSCQNYQRERAKQSKDTTKKSISNVHRIQIDKEFLEINEHIKNNMSWASDMLKSEYMHKKLMDKTCEIFCLNKSTDLPKEVIDYIKELVSNA